MVEGGGDPPGVGFDQKWKNHCEQLFRPTAAGASIRGFRAPPNRGLRSGRSWLLPCPGTYKHPAHIGSPVALSRLQRHNQTIVISAGMRSAVHPSVLSLAPPPPPPPIAPCTAIYGVHRPRWWIASH